MIALVFEPRKKVTVEARYFEVPREMEKKFEIAGFRNNQGSVKGKGKSKGIRSSCGDFELTEFEIAGFDCISNLCY